MSLHYEYFKKGIEVIPFGPTKDEWVEPEPYFVVSGDQKEVHSYLEAVSNTQDLKFNIYYDMKMESRHTAVGFSDAMVSITFCFAPINALDESTFKDVFITPHSKMFI